MQVWTHFQLQICPDSFILSKGSEMEVKLINISVYIQTVMVYRICTSLLHLCLPADILPYLNKTKTEL